MRNRVVHELRIEPVNLRERRSRSVFVSAQRVDDLLTMIRRGRRDVEDIARLDARAAVMDFLGDDLGDGFKLDRFAFDDALCRRR